MKYSIVLYCTYVWNSCFLQFTFVSHNYIFIGKFICHYKSKFEKVNLKNIIKLITSSILHTLGERIVGCISVVYSLYILLLLSLENCTNISQVLLVSNLYCTRNFAAFDWNFGTFGNAPSNKCGKVGGGPREVIAIVVISFFIGMLLFIFLHRRYISK